MQPANAFAEIDLVRHVEILDWLITHRFSRYCLISSRVALRAEMRRIFVIVGSSSDQRYTTESSAPFHAEPTENQRFRCVPNRQREKSRVSEDGASKIE